MSLLELLDSVERILRLPTPLAGVLGLVRPWLALGLVAVAAVWPGSGDDDADGILS